MSVVRPEITPTIINNTSILSNPSKRPGPTSVLSLLDVRMSILPVIAFRSRTSFDYVLGAVLYQRENIVRSSIGSRLLKKKLRDGQDEWVRVCSTRKISHSVCKYQCRCRKFEPVKSVLEKYLKCRR